MGYSSAVLLTVLVGLVGLVGCASVQPDLALEIRQVPVDARPPVPKPDGLKVAVAPFADERADPTRVGTLVHFWRQQTRFTVVGNDIGRIAAEMFVDYLKRELGFRSWLDKPGVVALEGGPDVELGGRLVDYHVTANSRLVGVKVQTTLELVISARNSLDGRSVQLRFKAEKSEWVFGFTPHVAEEQLYATFLQAIGHFLAQKEVEKLLP